MLNYYAVNLKMNINVSWKARNIPLFDNQKFLFNYNKSKVVSNDNLILVLAMSLLAPNNYSYITTCFVCAFSLFYSGECWGGPDDSAFYLKGHAQLGGCADQCFNDCACSTRFCAGKNFTNAVYAISKHWSKTKMIRPESYRWNKY